MPRVIPSDLVQSRKYRNKKVEYDGFLFDSQKEANRYAELKLLERAGEISDLELQPRFEIIPTVRWNGKTYQKIFYVSDFSYREKGNPLPVVEEVKGYQTEEYRLKLRLFLLQHVGEPARIDFRVIR